MFYPPKHQKQMPPTKLGTRPSSNDGRMTPMRQPCDICGEQLDTSGTGVVRKITCWAENNKSGRPSKIREAVDLGMYAHRICFETQKTPNTNQNSLF